MANPFSSAVRPSSRYSSIDSRSSSSEASPSSSHLKFINNNNSSSKLSSTTKHARRHSSDTAAAAAATDSASRAIVRTGSGGGNVVPTSARNPPTFGTMVKKFMEKRSNLKPASAAAAANRFPNLPIPADLMPADTKKKEGNRSSNLAAALHRKLFHKTKPEGDRPSAKALTEVKANTRTLAMVLRSERELLNQNKDFEEEIQHLRLLLHHKDQEAEKLKDLCLKQREEIKALKDAILFPDVMNSQLQELLEKQGSELKQARHIIPSLQKRVSSLTGQLHSLAQDLAEVKAEKYVVSQPCFDLNTTSPQTPKSDRDAQNSLENSSGCPMTYGSPDEMFLKDLNPCLTPCFSKTQSKEYDQMFGCDSPRKDTSLQNSIEFSPGNFSGCRGGILSRSSELCQRSSNGIDTTHKIYKSDERKRSIGKPKHQNLF